MRKELGAVKLISASINFPAQPRERDLNGRLDEFIN